MRTRAFVALFSVAPLLVGASEPLRLQPATPWGVDYAENSCRLVRTFGQGNDQTQLVLESIAPGEMSMTLIGSPLRADMSPVGDTQIDARFVPGQDNWFFGIAAKADRDGRAAGLWNSVPFMPILSSNASLSPELKRAMDQARERARKGERPPALDPAKHAQQLAERQTFAAHITELEIQARPGHPIFLETGSFGDPLKVFDQCVRELIRSWGVDPAVQDKIARTAWAPNVRSWFSSADYPRLALQKGEEASVTFRVIVDATGRVTKCQSFSHYNAPEFNTAVCDVLRAGRFAPAELADGTKVPSYYTQTVSFRIAG